ncbi:O-antigen ligase family protein [Jeotgalibacillus malaysiensis]|uniref:O-antigen ligase family protein n=1 Tax=Jeotgalibacillus malaysiensis TaxID=1508404 RepID=UPI0038509DDF
MLKSLQTNEKLILLFFYFIALQPIIDVLTTFSITQLQLSATVGVLIRILYMGLSALFLLINWKNSKIAKYAVIYLAAWGIYLLVNLGISYIEKPIFYFGEEIKYLVKLSYFNVVLLNFVFLFRYFSKNLNLAKVFFHNLMIASIFIGVVMVVAILTGTSLESYEWTKTGFTGWFFAGNELGASLAMILPIVLYFAILRTEKVKHFAYWIPFILVSFSLIMIGTKVGYGAVAITLVMGLVSAVIALIAKVKHFGNLKVSAAFALALLIILGALTPFTPVFMNTYAHIDLLEDQRQKEQEQDPIEDIDEEPVEEEESNLNSLILSNRDLFLNQFGEYYAEAPVTQKVFGMGYAGNFEEVPKMIEMDYSDVFYSVGIIGTILYFLPLLYIGISVIRNILKEFKAIFFPHYALVISSIVLGLGIAHFAGHVFTAPGVSIYLAIVAAYFYHHLKTQRV